jgi:hypothetical protein
VDAAGDATADEGAERQLAVELDMPVADENRGPSRSRIRDLIAEAEKSFQNWATSTPGGPKPDRS